MWLHKNFFLTFLDNPLIKSSENWHTASCESILQVCLSMVKELFHSFSLNSSAIFSSSFFFDHLDKTYSDVKAALSTFVDYRIVGLMLFLLSDFMRPIFVKVRKLLQKLSNLARPIL